METIYVDIFLRLFVYVDYYYTIRGSFNAVLKISPFSVAHRDYSLENLVVFLFLVGNRALSALFNSSGIAEENLSIILRMCLV